MTEKNDTVDYLRKVTAALQETKQRLRKYEDERHEPIAIVSMACRFPGGVENPEDLWRLLDEGRDAVTEVPAFRWDVDAVFDPGPEVPGRTYARWGGFVGEVDRFDPSFFGINAIEAKSCDPQQRLLLETTWETIERAGLKPSDLAGSATGVFVGIFGNDYQVALMSDHQAIDAYSLLGTAHGTMAGRISYWLDLQGPNFPVDTACSSSAVALHLACQALRNGECNMALAGGVNLLLSPWGYLYLSKLRALSPRGRCHTFSDDADGFVRAEGCGMVLLKRLSDAQRAGDEILAVIRGSAINHDGRSNGFTAPSGPAQEDVIRRALAQARVEAATVDVVECHGTGTPLGDPIEVQALGAVYGTGRPPERPLVLGSIKTNIGHAEGAAGIAGVMKAVLSLQHHRIPRSLHFARPNPHIPWDELRVRVAGEALAWERNAHPRRMGVSSFGMSGTNVHLILEEAPVAPAAPVAVAAAEPVVSAYLLPLSAKSPEALVALARSYGDYLSSSTNDARLEDIAYTAGVRRVHREHRLGVAGRTREELAAALLAFSGDGAADPLVGGSPTSASSPKVVFVFSGQGSQWVGMGQRLLAEEPVFRASLVACDASLRQHVSWSLLDELSAPEGRSRLGETEIVQPALFAIQVGLVQLLKSWGITPDAVLGHSVGEVAAAHVAGALSLEEATRLVASRGRIMQKATGLGKMTWVALPLEDAEKAIAGREAVLAVAAVNDPGSVVLSGEAAALDEVVANLSGRGVDCRSLKVNYAFHSPQMDGLARELVEALGRVDSRRATIPVYSTVTGAAIEGEALDAAYWGKNVREPVQFARAVASAFGAGQRLFLEIGPHPVLATNLTQCLGLQAERGHALFTLRRQSDEPVAMRQALGALYARGLDVAWKQLFPSGGRCVTLPTYRWQRERYWIDVATQPGGGARRAPATPGGHPLLGAAFRPADRPDAYYWEQWLSVNAMPYLGDHRVRGEVVFPGAAYVEMALAAGEQVYGEGAVLEDLSFEWILLLGESTERRVQMSLVGDQGEPATIDISSRSEDSNEWVRHVRATVREGAHEIHEAGESPRRIQERCSSEISGAEHYARMDARNIHYGPAFQGVERIWVGATEALGRVRLPTQAGDAAAYRIHPALLDACFQVSAALFGAAAPEATFVPVAIERLRLHARPPREVWVRAELAGPGPESDGMPAVNLVVVDEAGRPLLDIARLFVQRLAPATGPDPFARCAYAVQWRRQDLAEVLAVSAPSSLRRRAWVVFADAGGVGGAVALKLRERGEACIEVAAGRRFERRGPSRYVIDPSKAEDYQLVFRDIVSNDVVVQGVMHLWSLDAESWEGTTEETLLADVRRGTQSALHVMQNLVSQGFRDAPRLMLVTRGAQVVGDEASRPAVAQAPLLGLARTIAMEQPDLACIRVDLAPVRTRDDATLLIRELLSGDGEDQIALREEGRLVARLERGDLAPAEAPVFQGGASYVITGGLGGLGLSAARWLVSQGARHVVLVGRSDPSATALEAMRAMEQAGAQVRAWRADVSRGPDMADMFTQLKQLMPPVRGVIHAAGILEDRTLQDMGEEQFWKPIHPKVLGAWNLHTATRDLALDFFVMYSSASALLGPPGQGNYAAANAFVDALAHARAAEGLPAMSIQWGVFSDVGLAAAQANRGQRLSHRGIDSFTPEEGNELLGRLLQRPQTEVGLLRMSVRQWVEFYPRAAAAPFLAELRQQEGRAATTPSAGRFRDALEALSTAERRAALERHVLECLALVLGRRADRIDVHAPFQGYGMDSLMSLEIRNRLEASLGLRLSASLLYTYSTTATLVEHLLGEMPFELRAAPHTSAELRRTADPNIQFFELSEESVRAILDEKLLDLEDYLK